MPILLSSRCHCELRPSRHSDRCAVTWDITAPGARCTTRPQWPGLCRRGPWGATLPSPHGRAACLTLPGDTAGENLDIVVKKCAAAASAGRVPHHEPAGTRVSRDLIEWVERDTISERWP